MKSAILTFSLISGLVVGAQAATADMQREVIRCQVIPNIPDRPMTVSIVEGGLIGKPQLVIRTLSFNRPASTQNYIVTKVVSQRAGAPLVYEGPGVQFSLAATVAPRPGGSRPGKVEIKTNRGRDASYQLDCKFAK